VSAVATKPNRARRSSIASSKLRKRSLTILTVGHSTRAIDDFIRLLQAHGVTCLVDVRTIPRSRYNPQFNLEVLGRSLKRNRITYVHIAELGGLRHTSLLSRNTAWRNSSFRGFADYMQTSEFETALRKLLRLAQRGTLAVMCAEALPWRCHRWLIADALVARGIQVEHIMSANNRRAHALTAFAKVRGNRVVYPGPQALSKTLKASNRSVVNLPGAPHYAGCPERPH
jgi:uncharacterized protein (DUF488 family)